MILSLVDFFHTFSKEKKSEKLERFKQFTECWKIFETKIQVF